MQRLKPQLSALLSCLATDPDNPALLLEIADLALDLGEAGHARMALERLGTGQADDTRRQAGALTYRKAVLAFIESRFEDSLNLSSQLIAAGVAPASHPSLLQQHAMSLLKLGRYRQAADTLAPLARDAGAAAEVKHRYLRALHWAGELEEAITFAELYLQSQGNDVDAKGQLSLIHLDHQDFNRAHELARETLASAPANLDALLAGGGAAAALADAQTARTLFLRAADLAPDNGRARLGLGMVALFENDLDKAQRLLEQAVSLMPDHLGSWNALAWVCILNMNLEQAWQTLEHVRNLDRNFGETWGAMAVVATLRGQYQRADRLIKLALRLQPGSIAARYARHLLATKRGEIRHGASLLEALLTETRAPAGGTLKDLIARCSARQRSGAH